MKTAYVSLIICLFSASNLYSQSDSVHFIESITIIPSSPTTNDTIKIVTSTTIPQLGHEISFNFTQRADTFNLIGCFSHGALDEPQTYWDTLNVGILTAGPYYIQYIANLTTAQTLCIVVDSNSATASFHVTAASGFNNIDDVNNRFSLYPDPFSNQLTVGLSNNNQSTIILYDIFSRQILHRKFINAVTINTELFPDGIYFYELRVGVQTIKTGKVIKH